MPEASECTLVSGASSPLGRAIAVRLSRSRRLILHGRNADALQQTRAACELPERHAIWNCDLAQSGGIEQSLSKFLRGQSLAVDGFVHCAGVARLSPMRLLDAAAIEETMRVNFTSSAVITSLLLRKSVNAARLKAVVFISSVSSQFGVKGFNIYSASKGALDALMKSLAVELAPAVRVNSVLPGALSTGGLGSGDAALAEKVSTAAPLGPGQPDDVAGAVEFLLSDNARWITGQQIVVDGGFTTNATL